MAEHLKVLGGMSGRSFGISEALSETDALDGRLGNALNDRWRLNAKRVEHGGYHVDGVGKLRADLALRFDLFGPMDNERVAGAAAIGLALPAAEGGIARPGPTPGVVVEGLRTTQLVDLLQALLKRLRCIVEELTLVGGAGGAALGAGTVIRDDHDQGVVELVDALQVVEQATNVIVCVGQEAGEDLHHAGVELLLLW